jgi:transposase-like protein
MSHNNGKQPDPEVRPKAQRRRFTAEYKRRILAEAEACGYGEIGALLRREGLYHSNLATWRKERDAGTLIDKKRGPQPNPEAAEMKRLQQENTRLKRKLEQAEAIIAAQKKLAVLLEDLNREEAQ